MWWFPYGSYFVIAAILAVLAAMAFTPALASQVYASLLCLAVAVAAYFGLRRPRRHAESRLRPGR